MERFNQTFTDHNISELQYTDFDECVFRDLRDTLPRIRHCDFYRCRFINCNFSHFEIQFCSLQNVTFEECNLSSVDFFNSRCRDVTWIQSSLSRALFSHTQLQYLSFKDTKLGWSCHNLISYLLSLSQDEDTREFARFVKSHINLCWVDLYHEIQDNKDLCNSVYSTLKKYSVSEDFERTLLANDIPLDEFNHLKEGGSAWM